MNFYFLCLVSLITLISVKDVLNLSNTVVLIIGGLVLIAMVLYKTNIESFSLSKKSLRTITDSLQTAKKQRKELDEVRKKVSDLKKRI